MCAGILSRRAAEGMAALGLALPPQVIRALIRAYQLHWDDHSISIDPPDATRQVLSVYRAGGPRKSPYEPTDGFDAFLLSQAQARGARILSERVERVIFDGLPCVRTSAREDTFDLVVLAIGVNATPPVLQNLDYAHPPTAAMAQNELLVEPAPNRGSMDSTVHVYFEQPRDLIFGALIPKGQFANVSLLGSHFGRDSVDQFLAVPEVAEIVGNDPARMCGCRPHVAVAPARGYYADRFVAVGDACVTRLYKDGIGSAFVTAHAAAETALRHGISRTAFAAHYAPVCRAIANDNRFGQVVFGLVKHSKWNALFKRGLGHALKSESKEEPGARVIGQTLWALFTGDSTYEEIFRMMVMPKSIARLANAMLRELVG
jgi:flavin-dependent dehydrogenase